MSESIDSRELLRTGEWVVRAELLADGEATPEDGDWATARDVAWFRQGSWRYVGVRVTVEFGGVDIASDSLWGVAHGLMPSGDVEGEGEARDVDAWEWTPSVTEGNTIMMGSPLYSVAEVAIGEAREWVLRLVGRSPEGEVIATNATSALRTWWEQA